MPILDGLEDLLHVDRCTPGRVCAEIASIFHVRQTDVGLLWLEDGVLRFLFPVELQSAGSIPLSSSAVAARTASTKQAEIFNNFPRVPHHSIFEQIRLNGTQPLTEMPDPIQKLISAPILGDGGVVLGVIQVCRKGMTPGIAGPDFNDEDVDLLRRAARRIAMLMPEIEYIGDGKQPPQMLRFNRSLDRPPKRANAS
jgi:GAF domain-containing protein